MSTNIKFLGMTSLLILLVASSACKKDSGGAGGSDLKSETEKVSYILGYSTGKSFSEQSVDVDSQVFLRGLKDGLKKDEESKVMTEDQMRETMQNFRTSLMEKRKKEMEEASVKNQKAGEDFLAKNKAKPGVVTLPSGLQYKVITEGKGEKPSANDSVTVDYNGTLINGKTFDSTKTRGKPATFPVGTTIPGMAEALQLMASGSTWEIYVPATLGYGAQGAGSAIGPNETLIFNVSLISITKGTAKAAPKDEKKAVAKKK